jgi:hypothetical protein
MFLWKRSATRPRLAPSPISKHGKNFFREISVPLIDLRGKAAQELNELHHNRKPFWAKQSSKKRAVGFTI